MQKNDYRRALIMLRSLLNGYSGHARIEIRTLTGNLNIRAQIPQGAQSVRAALVGKRSSLYFAHPLGNLRRDMRGQAGLSVNFDPRDIGGRTLDAYSLLAIATISGGVCQLALVGNLNGARENDWERIRNVVCSLYAPQPRPEEPLTAAPYSRTAEPETAEAETCEGDSCPVSFEAEQDESADENSDEGIVWDFAPDEPEEAAEAETDTAAEEYDVPAMFRQDGWSYARTALPAGCGYAFAWIGTPACGGEVCVALRGNFDTEPPIGLDDYQWIGENGAGWWIRCYQTVRTD